MKYSPRWWLPMLLGLAAMAGAGEVHYEYDDAGRLKAVTYPDQSQRAYTLDAAGNRTQVQDATPPGVPASITVPATSTTGNYSISWTAATGTVTAYELYEATNSTFSAAVRVYSGTAITAPLSGKANGTYYYQVRACNGSACSNYRAGANATSVTLPPGVPASITVPASNTTGSYTISWGSASGALTAYQLYESTSSTFTSQTQVYSGTGTSSPISGKASGTYYYRVRACNGASCSGYRTGAAGIVVTVAPATPASITIPSTSTGTHTVSWASVAGPVTAYELYESTSSTFSTQTQVYSGTGTSQSLTKGNGTYYYRVRACNTTGCSGYRTGGNSVVVTVPAGIPASISVPASSTTGNYTISWGTATGTVTAYELYESTSSTFSTQTQVYTGTATSKALTGRGNGTYYYRVRACNGTSCSGYATGANPTTVALPPGAPASISVPSTNTTGSYSVSWGTATGTVTAYELYESTSSTFSTQTQVYTGTGTSQSLSKGSGTYYYRVRACNGSSCSGYATGANPTTVTLPPGSPASITVPAGSTTGSYSVSWGAATGTVTAYELYESTSSTFSTQTQVYSGTGTAQSLSKGNGTYYYRVRACNGSSCSGYTTGGNPTTVTLPPGTPASISVPSTNTTGSYSVSWGTATGTVTAYELYESTSSTFSTQTQVYSGTGTSQSFSKGNGTYYYRVRACNGTSCSGYATGANPTTVTLPPGNPASISVPAGSTTGSYSVSWGASTGTLTAYELYESTSSTFSTQTLVYSGTGTSQSFSKGNGTYYYRVRACYVSACSGYSTGANAMSVTLTPGIPTSITVPTTSTTGNYSISWGSAACCNEISNYELYEATNSSFTGQQLVSNNATLSTGFTKSPGTTYYYRVRACYQSACSDYRTGANGVTVQSASQLTLSDMSIGGGGYYPSGASAFYMLDGAGNILVTPSDGVGSGGTVVDVGDWLTPKVGMGSYQAMATASCSGLSPIGIFNTWRPLSQSQSWGAGTIGWNTSGSCTISVTIGMADGTPVGASAVITIDLWAGE